MVVLASASSSVAGDPALTTEVVATGLDVATYIASPPDDASRLFVTQQNGEIRVVEDGMLLATPFLDIANLVPNETFNGLLGIAFHPSYAKNGHFYLHHPRGAGASDRITIARYTASDDPNVADPTSREEIMVLPYPATPGHHVGGWIGFGPDGYLYVPLGDGNTTGGEAGGGARAQSLDSPWGKVLRIDVNGDDFPDDDDRDYAIPAHNPFVGAGGNEAVWSLGLRQPYRASFDRETGDFWIADVGLFAREEIDFQPASSTGGENYGWNCAEGDLCTSNGNCSCQTGELTAPIIDYTHAFGCSLSGGAVYRGSAIPDLAGTYFYADYCSNRIWSLRYENGEVVDAVERTDELEPPGAVAFDSILAIGEGPGGELYISDNNNVYRIVPAEPLHIMISDPPDGYIDSRQPLDLDGDAQGISTFIVTFDGDVSALNTDSFGIAEEGGAGTPPSITSVTQLDDDRVRLRVSPRLTVGAWTTITYVDTDSSIRVGYLPGDINGNATTGPTDILALIDSLNGITPLPDDSTDINRDGTTGPLDILRLIDLLNGAGDLDPWNGVSLP
jgi:glucose/arabinose dehydrogenase